MKKITFEKAFKKQIELLKFKKGILHSQIKNNFDDYITKYKLEDFKIDTVLPVYNKMKHYHDGTKKKVGEKILYALLFKNSVLHNSTVIKYDINILDFSLNKIEKIKDKYDFFENTYSDLIPIITHKESIDSKNIEKIKKLFFYIPIQKEIKK